MGREGSGETPRRSKTPTRSKQIAPGRLSTHGASFGDEGLCRSVSLALICLLPPLAALHIEQPPGGYNMTIRYIYQFMTRQF